MFFQDRKVENRNNRIGNSVWEGSLNYQEFISGYSLKVKYKFCYHGLETEWPLKDAQEIKTNKNKQNQLLASLTVLSCIETTTPLSIQ